MGMGAADLRSGSAQSQQSALLINAVRGGVAALREIKVLLVDYALEEPTPNLLVL
jgi:hypothetical protein